MADDEDDGDAHRHVGVRGEGEHVAAAAPMPGQAKRHEPSCARVTVTGGCLRCGTASLLAPVPVRVMVRACLPGRRIFVPSGPSDHVRVTMAERNACTSWDDRGVCPCACVHGARNRPFCSGEE